MNNDMDKNLHFDFISQQMKDLMGLYRDAVSDLGVSENEFWILYTIIAMEEECSQQDICNLWSMSKQTVNTIIMNMVKKAYVVLEVVPGTRNRKIIRLTKEGEQYGESIVLPVLRAEERALSKLSSKERLACVAALNKYTAFFRDELNTTGSQNEKL